MMKVTTALFFLSSLFAFANSGGIRGVVPIPKQDLPKVPIEKYIGKVSGNVAKAPVRVAAVWLDKEGISAPKSPKPVVLGQTNYQFDQSLIVVPLGTEVKFPNNDADYHNIYSLSRVKRFDLGRYKKDETPAPSVVFDKPGFVVIHCEIHDHMNAHVVVVDSPFYSVTKSSGEFVLKNIPAGNYTLYAQLDRKTSWKIPVQVTAGRTINITFPKR